MGAWPDDVPALGQADEDGGSVFAPGDRWHLTARERNRLLSDRRTTDPGRVRVVSGGVCV
ncbi:hypothetical protein AXA44_23835 [Rhodococcus sp. SC4]|nr:hypothetical protein AXA44_23835 [Rhodococcus sp. SC4]